VNVSLYQAAAALNANSKWQEVISQNLASASIPGFKKQTVSFDTVQSGYLESAKTKNRVGLPSATTQTSFSAGEIRYTGGKTDMAIEGTGFFEIQLANGSTAYTRDGEFHINSQGQMVTKSGDVVALDGGGTFSLSDSSPIIVSSTGQITQGNTSRGKMRVVEFSDPKLLTPVGGGLFINSNTTLTATPASQVSLKQGYLEAANTSAVSEMVNLISVMRSYEANSKTIQLNDERMSRAISELGNPS
jgi:flagellar basal-body rod protein FlgG